MDICHPSIIETDRLRLVDFTPAHLDDFALMNADAEVMAFFPARLSRDESAALLQRIIDHQQQYGFSLFALHQKRDDCFIGFTGLLTVGFEAHFTPAVEIGWRFAKSAWGQGLGPEAARACLAYGFDDIGLKQIVSFTAAINQRSVRVMEKIGMQHDPKDDFDHPKLPSDDRLSRHVLYRCTAP